MQVWLKMQCEWSRLCSSPTCWSTWGRARMLWRRPNASSVTGSSYTTSTRMGTARHRCTRAPSRDWWCWWNLWRDLTSSNSSRTMWLESPNQTVIVRWYTADLTPSAVRMIKTLLNMRINIGASCPGVAMPVLRRRQSVHSQHNRIIIAWLLPLYRTATLRPS